MPLNSIWVFAEALEGTVHPTTRELLTKARSMGAGEVAAFHAGDGAAGARQEITSVTAAEAREAGEIVEDDGEAYQKIIQFLESKKVL